MMALANDQVKSADYAKALSMCLELLISEKYHVTINEQLNDVIDGYLDVAKKCMQTLIDTISNDLRPATKQLFQGLWYDGMIVQIAETMRDYMSDYQTYLNGSLLELLIEELLEAFLVAYLTALANTQKLRMPMATEQIRQDIAEVFKFFSTLKPALSFTKVHGPNLGFVECLMKVCGDLDRLSVNKVMDSIKHKVKDENLMDHTWHFA